MIFSTGAIYFLLLSLLHWGLRFDWGVSGFMVGGILGIMLLDIDRFLYVFYTRSEEESSKIIRQIFKEKRYKEGIISLLNGMGERTELVLHSAIFGPVIFILAIFALTSSGSMVGAGVTLGAYLRYLIDIESYYKKNPEFLNKRLFWQLKMEISERAKNTFLLLLLLGFLISSIMFIR